METAQALIVVVGFGALLAARGIVHFQEGQPPEEIRFSVPQERYFFALGVHGSVFFAVYALLVLAIYGMALIARGEAPHFSCYQVPIPSDCKELFESLEVINPDVLVLSALLAAIFMLVLPNVPIL